MQDPLGGAGRLSLQPMSVVNGVALPRQRHQSTTEVFLLVAGGMVILFNLTIIIYVLLTMQLMLQPSSGGGSAPGWGSGGGSGSGGGGMGLGGGHIEL